MKKTRLPIISFSVIMCALLCAAAIVASCARKPEAPAEELEGISNFSYSIFVSRGHAIPKKGTFGWGPRYMKVEYMPEMNLAELDQRLRDSVREALEARSYTYSEENPDLIIGYGVAFNAEIDEESLNAIYGESFKFTFAAPEEQGSRTYHQGTVILDFLDAESNTLLWRGVGQGDVDLDVSTEVKDQRSRALARLLLRRFPDPDAVK
jgi:hypothetical protein